MNLSFPVYFVIFLLPAFGISYLLFRWWTSAPLKEGLALSLTLSNAFPRVGDAFEVEISVENATRHVIPFLKLELLLPDGLVFEERVGRSAAGIWLLRAGNAAVCRYRVIARAAGDYDPDSLQLIAVCNDPLGQGVFSRRLLPRRVVGSASNSVLLRVSPAAEGEKAAASTPRPAPAPSVEAGDHREARRLCRSGKLLAYVGLTAILILPLRLLYTWGARAYAPLLALILTPPLVALGYAVQYLLLSRKQRRARVDEWNFSFESGRLRVPLWRILLASALAAVPAGTVGAYAGRITVSLLQNELVPANEEVGVPLIVIGCMVSAVVGCLLLPFKFQQLLSVRTMAECLAPLVFLFGLQIFWGNGLDGSFVLCVAVWLLCLAICMNREAILKMYLPVEAAGERPEGSAELRPLARTGTVMSALLWLTALLIALPLAALGVVFRAGVLLLCIPPLAVFIAYRRAARAKEKRENREKDPY